MQTNQETSSNITLLPEHIIDQIKAGEVIERPAHLIKEVLENSLDAGSQNISLHIIGEGMELISIEDDGHGMHFADLPFAFCRHATSKITNFEDLYKLHTFGFRGEALASIAAVAKINCTSTPHSSLQDGGRITLESGHVTSHTHGGGPKPGTSLYIKDLFYNTPARLKFIKSAQSEKNAIRKMIDSFVISHPHISFSIRFDEQDKILYPAVDTAEKRIKQLFFKSKKRDERPLIHLQKSYEGHDIEVFLTPDSVKGTLTRKQFLFANDRLFIDKQIHQMLTRSMESRGWSQGPGSYYVCLTVPPSQLDVNVHPNKTYIKFLKHALIMSLISSELKGLDIVEPQNELIPEPLSPSPEGKMKPITPLSSYVNSPFTHAPNRESFTERQTINHHRHSPVNEVKHPYYQMIDSEEGHLFINKVSLVATICSYLQKLPEEDDSWQTPLLISEPFAKETFSFAPNALQEAKKVGFIFDDLDDSTIALRSIPSLFTSVDYKYLIQCMILSDMNLDALDLTGFDVTSSFINNVLGVPELKKVMTTYAIRLDSPQLKNLFH